MKDVGDETWKWHDDEEELGERENENWERGGCGSDEEVMR